MKRLIFFLILLPFLSACPDNSDKDQEDHVKAFRENGYDFTNLKKQGYKNIKFKMPTSFEFDYGMQYCFKNSGLVRRDQQLGIVFTVERLTENDLESELMEDYVIEDDLLNGFHNAYASRRYESLHNASISFKKDTKKNVKFKGITQTISGARSEYDEVLYYNMASLKIKDEYYIFQFISKKEMMDYVLDDFERILTTVRTK